MDNIKNLELEDNTIAESHNLNANINYDVFNALNLVNEELGQSYLNTGFNPLGANFKLETDYIISSLENEKNAQEVESPDFINKGSHETKKAFNLSLQNCTKLLIELQNKLNDPNLSPEDKKKLQKLIAQIQMFIELLNIYIKNKKDKNYLKMYQNLLAINWSLFNELSLSFEQSDYDYKNIATQIAINFLNSQNKEADKLKAQARQIIENNLKQQELQEKLNKLKEEQSKTALKEEPVKETNIEQVKEEQSKQQPPKTLPKKMSKLSNKTVAKQTTTIDEELSK